jgi:hypothetical protein
MVTIGVKARSNDISAACAPADRSNVVATAIPNLDVMMHLIADAPCIKASTP